ncbi:hypothetical protein GCM10009563_13830 [Subtercola frigoramans]
MVVHHVDVHEVCRTDPGEFGLEIGKVGGQDAGIDTHGHGSSVGGFRYDATRLLNQRRLSSSEAAYRNPAASELAEDRDEHRIGTVPMGPQLGLRRISAEL